MSGIIYGLGVGPGDPELITLKAWRILRRAAVVAYPAPEERPSFARSIVASFLSPAQIELPIRIPMEAARFPAQAVYDRAAEEIARHSAAGRDIAVLCQGDPFFYGSFMYLFARLAAAHRVVVVPGITSMAAGAAALGEPLVARNETLAVIPASLPDLEIERRLAAADAVVLVKVGRHFARIRALLSSMRASPMPGFCRSMRSIRPRRRISR